MPHAYRYFGLSEDAESKMRTSMSETLKPRHKLTHGNRIVELPPAAIPTDTICERKQIDPYKHLQQMKDDVEQSVLDADEARVVAGVRFPKGEAVVLPDNHPLLAKKPKRDIRLPGGVLFTSKMDGLVENGEFEDLGMQDGATVSSPAGVRTANPLATMPWHQAVASVRSVESSQLLGDWLAAENRKSVREAIEERIAHLGG